MSDKESLAKFLKVHKNSKEVLPMAMKPVLVTGWDVDVAATGLPQLPPGCFDNLRFSCGGGSPELLLTCPSIQSEPGDTSTK